MAALASSSGSGHPPGDGADGGWRAYATLNVSGFAWDFLRRNPAYRLDFEQGVARSGCGVNARWGLRFPADPLVGAGDADVFWRPDVAPGIVVPLTTGGGERHAIALPVPVGPVRIAEEGLHMRLAAGLQLLLQGLERAEGPLVVMLEYDASFGVRVRAVEALHRAASGRSPLQSRLTQAQRARLARCLVALDGRLRGDSYRAIAAALFGERAIADQPWRTASLRAATIRLVTAGKGLMEGGYLKLLRGGL